MARYAYPILKREEDTVLGIATSVDNCTSLIEEYARKRSDGFGGAEYELSRSKEELASYLEEHGKIRVDIRAYKQNRREEKRDETLVAERMKVNEMTE